MESIFETLKGNTMVATAIGLSSAGIITFWIKDFPKKVISFLQRQFTTDLTITSQNVSFHNIMKWVEKNYQDKNFRKLKITNGRWGYETTSTTSIGYGKHFLKYDGKFLLIELIKEQSHGTSMDKETVIITKLGRNRKTFDALIEEIQKVDDRENKTKVHKMVDCWEFVKDQPKRSIESVFIESEKRNDLIRSIKDFKSSEKWYLDNGIPYQFGILLHGAPGTGKTSMIKAIAGYLDYPIYYLSPGKLNKIEIAMSTLPDKCLVVIEDIDSNSTTHSREVSSKDSSSGEESMVEAAISKFEAVSLSEILNSLDGMFSAHGRILVATTNHREQLDKALIRPGRIDLQIEIGFVTIEVLKEFCDNFFPDHNTVFDSAKMKNGITVAVLQNMILRKNGIEDILKYALVEYEKEA